MDPVEVLKTDLFDWCTRIAALNAVAEMERKASEKKQ